MKDFILHNPRCSKSRQTLALLERPVVVYRRKAALGRPPGNVLSPLAK